MVFVGEASGHGSAGPLFGFHHAEIKVWARLHSHGSLTGEESAPKLPHIVGRIHFLAAIAFRIPGTGEPGRLPSMGSHRIRHDWSDLAAAAAATLMVESEEELKSLLMKVKEESEKSWLKAQHSENWDHGIQSHHFMGNRWGNSGNSGWLSFSGLQNHRRWWLQPWN